MRNGAACLYGVGNVADCEIGIVQASHSHFHNWDEAIEFCRAAVRGKVEYTVWRQGDKIVGAQRNHPPLPDGRRQVDVTEALSLQPVNVLREETLRFKPYVPE